MTDTTSTRPQMGDEEILTAVKMRLREHWLTGIHCDHERKTDRASCSCSVWRGEEKPSIAAAVQDWVEHAMPVFASLPQPTAGSTGELDLLDLLRKAGASEKDAKPFTRTIWKDSIDIDEPTYVLEKFAKLLIEAATGPAQSTAEVDRCNICGLVVDLRYKAEKPSIEFGMAGRAKTKAPPASTPAQSGLSLDLAHVDTDNSYHNWLEQNDIPHSPERQQAFIAAWAIMGRFISGPEQEAVDWYVVSDAVSDAISSAEGTPGATDLQRQFSKAGLLVLHKGDGVAVAAMAKASGLSAALSHAPSQPAPVVDEAELRGALILHFTGYLSRMKACEGECGPIDLAAVALKAIRECREDDDALRASPQPDRESELPADVVTLVCAARRVAFEDQGPEAIKALDTASEAFADRVPWEDEPDNE